MDSQYTGSKGYQLGSGEQEMRVQKVNSHRMEYALGLLGRRHAHIVGGILARTQKLAHELYLLSSSAADERSGVTPPGLRCLWL